MSVKVVVDVEKCDLCGLCVEYCPSYVFTIVEGRVVVDESRCIECYACIPLCPKGAIKVEVVEEN